MTEKTQNRRWRVVLFFCGVGLLFVYFLYFLATGATDPAYNRWAQRYQPPQVVVDMGPGVLLIKNQEKITDRLKITYCGMEGNTIIVRFAVLELDPDYAYYHRMPMDEAKHGFYLSDNFFKLKSANRREIRLIPGLEQPGKAEKGDDK